MLKIAIVLGTRPEIIKMAPVVRAAASQKVDFFVLHTGQHYSYNLDGVFFEQLKLPQSRYNLEVGSGSHGEETGKMLIGIEKVLLAEKPTIVLVEGDTNSVLAGALAASKLHIGVGHVEAGLRSYDRAMPEEINRILTDHCSDQLYAPTEGAKSLLLSEGIPSDKIFVTGNTIVDAVQQGLEIAGGGEKVFNELGVRPREYILATLHRQENVDNKERLASILKGLAEASAEFKLPVIYPIHPRARKRLAEFGLEPRGVKMVEPLDYLGFLKLESQAKLILTDSGGVQEEACILGVPCVTLRDNTERPETVAVGANLLAGAEPGKILECSRQMLAKSEQWPNPFGDGHAGERIVGIIRETMSGK